MLQLLESAEVRDVLATGGVQFEQIRRMGPFGGVALQLQGLVQKGFNKVRANSTCAIVSVHEWKLTVYQLAPSKPGACCCTAESEGLDTAPNELPHVQHVYSGMLQQLQDNANRLLPYSHYV